MKNAYQLPRFCGNWSLHAGSKNAQQLVKDFAETMQLEPAKKGSKHISVFTKRQNTPFHLPEQPHLKNYIALSVMQPENENERYVPYLNLSSLLSLLAIQQGAVLLHTACAQRDEQGALFMGPGDVGKTTISERLPAPWRSMCDDTTLLYIKDDQVFAHPWPTWSCFTMDCPGGSWKVNERVPLRAIFLLKQSKKDAVFAIDKQSALNAIMQSNLQVNHSAYRRMSTVQRNEFVQKQIQIITEINKRIDSYYLENTLTGKFWLHIEKVWPQNPSNYKVKSKIKTKARDHVIYSGPSMFPVFHNPEYVTVRDYTHFSEIKKGDIIYFNSPVDDKKIIHRVIRKNNNRIRTRGDNNPTADPFWLSLEDIHGQVIRSVYKGRFRKIAGGFWGIQIYRKNLLGRQMLFTAQKLKKKTDFLWQHIHAISRFLINKDDLRIIEFSQPRHPMYKLYLDNKWIGQYNPVRHKWKLDGAYKFIIDKSKLPHPYSGG